MQPVFLYSTAELRKLHYTFFKKENFFAKYWNFPKTFLSRIFKLVYNCSATQTDRHYMNKTLRYKDFIMKSMQVSQRDDMLA